MRHHTSYITSLTLILLILSLMGCKKKLEPASYVIVDPVRHYYPVIQGEMLDVSYEIENTSSHPLFIQEIQTTCGCLVPKDELPIIILPERSGYVNLQFSSLKNTGYVCHWVYCYGNFKDTTCIEMIFDTNVVPKADYVHDYEQLWNETTKRKLSVRDFVDGQASQKGYYTEDLETPRTKTTEERQHTVDEHTP